MESGGTADAPPRRRASWSLKAIGENVAGKPIGEFQDPGKTPHPYVRASVEASRTPTPPREGATAAEEETYDPVGHVYPPLVGARGREYHGPENEHHAETLERHRAEHATGPGQTPHAPGPSHRPERLYLHYLLLHMDRLSDSALQYLRVAVEEEVTHRQRPLAPPPLPAPHDPVPAV